MVESQEAISLLQQMREEDKRNVQAVIKIGLQFTHLTENVTPAVVSPIGNQTDILFNQEKVTVEEPIMVEKEVVEVV